MVAVFYRGRHLDYFVSLGSVTEVDVEGATVIVRQKSDRDECRNVSAEELMEMSAGNVSAEELIEMSAGKVSAEDLVGMSAGCHRSRTRDWT